MATDDSNDSVRICFSSRLFFASIEFDWPFLHIGNVITNSPIENGGVCCVCNYLRTLISALHRKNRGRCSELFDSCIDSFFFKLHTQVALGE